MSLQDYPRNQPSLFQNLRIQRGASSQESAHRGLVTKDGEVQLSCSDEFLVILCVEFCKAQSHKLISEIRAPNPAEQDRRLEFLVYEIRRLLHHPQLFPSQSSRVRFLTFLAADARFQLCEAICSLLIKSEIHNIQETWRKNISRKAYLEGTRGWENFLLLNAPGLQFSSARTAPESMVQVMPPVATRIIADFEREEREILSFVKENNPLLGRPAQMTTMVDFDNPVENSVRVPDVELPQMVKPALFRPNPFQDRRYLPLALITTAAEHLEDYSALIDCLETDPPNPNAPQPVLSTSRVLPALAIRTWKLPTRAKDLRYIR